MLMSRSKYRSSVDVCADCGASDPSWASVNRGLLLCAECCSVHRSMGRHISHVKSLRQGSWPPSLLAMIHACTAQNVNTIWEHSLLDPSNSKYLRKKPQPKDPLHPTKSEFILAKHQRLEFVLHARRDEPPAELGRQLHSAVRSASLDTAMRLLAQGADPNYYNQEKGTTCLHVACRAGQPAQAELLVCWGADPSARDRNGALPADCARAGGHLELAQRMTECQFEATDRLVVYLTGAKPQHAGAGGRYILPPAPPALPHHMTDGAKAARGKLLLLPNHLFEELVMDIYDEVDRRETEEIWQTSACGLERCGVVFLPVNPALSAPRNQGRQKLARLSPTELMALLRDVLVDATRRQHIATLQPRTIPSMASDDEPLYDSVASDDDYAALAPIHIDMLNITPKPGDTVSTLYNPSLPSDFNNEPKPKTEPSSTHQIETLKKELDNRDSTISELKNQLKSLQTIVEQLTKENTVLKVSSVDDDNSIQSEISTVTLETNGSEEKVLERGKSMDTEQITRSNEESELRHSLRSGQRPVSMYETREGPKNNWQVTKHQLTTLSGLERSLTQSALESAPDPRDIHTRAEGVTRALHSLWSARTRPGLPRRGDDIRLAVQELAELFHPPLPPEVTAALTSLQTACTEVTSACAGSGGGGDDLRGAAYDLAKATKLLLTYYPLPA